MTQEKSHTETSLRVSNVSQSPMTRKSSTNVLYIEGPDEFERKKKSHFSQVPPTPQKVMANARQTDCPSQCTGSLSEWNHPDLNIDGVDERNPKSRDETSNTNRTRMQPTSARIGRLPTPLKSSYRPERTVSSDQRQSLRRRIRHPRRRNSTDIPHLPPRGERENSGP